MMVHTANGEGAASSKPFAELEITSCVTKKCSELTVEDAMRAGMKGDIEEMKGSLELLVLSTIVYPSFRLPL